MLFHPFDGKIICQPLSEEANFGIIDVLNRDFMRLVECGPKLADSPQPH